VARPVVVFSPLPPAQSGIADYTLELLPALAALRPVVVVTERPAQVPAGAGWRALGLEDYLRDASLGTCPHLYQIGNNADHVFAWRAFRRHPGILVQHDYNLHYLVEDATLGAGDHQGYREVLREEYGEAGATLADLRQVGLFSEAQKLALPLNTHLLRQAQGLIVHNHWVHDQVPADVRERTVVVPHHFAPQALHYDGLSPDGARASLGLPADEFVVLSLGYITPPKQIQATLAALAVLRRRGARLTYVIGGARNAGFDVDAHVQRLGLSECVRITGYLDEPSFFSYIRAADVLVNLRYPNVGESSGTLARALAMGVPAIVYNFGPLSEWPDDAVVKVPLELGQPTALAAALEGLMLNPGWRHQIGQRAQRHMRAHCTVEHSAALYSAFIDQVYEPSSVRADLDCLPIGQPVGAAS
jgi:glycosyltransferase involved in cell wall biosynthesis